MLPSPNRKPVTQSKGFDSCEANRAAKVSRMGLDAENLLAMAGGFGRAWTRKVSKKCPRQLFLAGFGTP